MENLIDDLGILEYIQKANYEIVETQKEVDEQEISVLEILMETKKLKITMADLLENYEIWKKDKADADRMREQEKKAQEAYKKKMETK